PNSQDDGGETPLHKAVRLSESSIARRLVKAGANPNIKDKNGNTPMTLAAEKQFRETDGMLLLLLDSGGDPNYIKPGNWSLMHEAIADYRGSRLLKRLLSLGVKADGEEPAFQVITEINKKRAKDVVYRADNLPSDPLEKRVASIGDMRSVP